MFDKWKDFVLKHLRSQVHDCQQLEIGVGISDEEVGSFLQRILAAKASKMRKTSETLIKIFLTIDDFDLPLLLATESSYISEAEDFYRKLFPLSILEIAK